MPGRSLQTVARPWQPPVVDDTLLVLPGGEAGRDFSPDDTLLVLSRRSGERVLPGELAAAVIIRQLSRLVLLILQTLMQDLEQH